MGGCDFTAAIVAEGWRKCRDEFPVTEEQPQVMINIIYFTPSWTSPNLHNLILIPPDLSLHCVLFYPVFSLISFIPALLDRELNCHVDSTPSSCKISEQISWHLDTSQYGITRV